MSLVDIMRQQSLCLGFGSLSRLYKRNPSNGRTGSKIHMNLKEIISSASARPLSGRGICATSFHGRPYEELGSKPSGRIQLAKTGATKSANAVRGRGTNILLPQ